MERLHFFDQTIIDEAVAAQMQHASGTMDDPFTAALGNMEDAAAAARASGGSTEFLTPLDGPTADWADWADWLIFGIGLIAAGLGFAGVIR